MPLATSSPSSKPVTDLMSSRNCLAYRFATAVSRSPLLSFRRVDPARLDRGSVSPCDLLQPSCAPTRFVSTSAPFHLGVLPAFDVLPWWSRSSCLGCSCSCRSLPTVRSASLSWLSRPLGSDIEKVPFVLAKAVSSLYRAPCIIVSNRWHLNLNRTEARQKASIMFQPFHVAAMRTLRAWAMDIFRVRRLPK